MKLNAKDAVVQINIKPNYTGREIIMSIYELGWVDFPYDKCYTWEYFHNREDAKFDKQAILEALFGYTRNNKHKVLLRKKKSLPEGEATLYLRGVE